MNPSILTIPLTDGGHERAAAVTATIRHLSHTGQRREAWSLAEWCSRTAACRAAWLPGMEAAAGVVAEAAAAEYVATMRPVDVLDGAS